MQKQSKNWPGVQYPLKGALDKYNIYFIPNSVEDFKIKPIPKFSADSVNAFSFIL